MDNDKLNTSKLKISYDIIRDAKTKSALWMKTRAKEVKIWISTNLNVVTVSQLTDDANALDVLCRYVIKNVIFRYYFIYHYRGF